MHVSYTRLNFNKKIVEIILNVTNTIMPQYMNIWSWLPTNFIPVTMTVYHSIRKYTEQQEDHSWCGYPMVDLY